jgi:hypothetical protein
LLISDAPPLNNTNIVNITKTFSKPFIISLSLAALAFASGCASLPEPVAVPTGEPLSVREHTETAHYTVKEKVGEVKYRDSKGYSRTDSVYANRKKTSHYQVWSAYQGDAKISDDDLYRIAKDEEAAREVQEKRESGVRLNRIGLGTMLVGAIVAGTGYALMSQAKEGDNTTPFQGMLYGGMVGVSIGTVLTYMGISKTHVEHPLDQSRATRAADNYNNGMTTGTTSTTSARSR